MVKKIRILDEIEPDPVLTEKEMQEKTYEFAKAIDWKLWELLQIAQRLEKNFPIKDESNSDEPVSVKSATKKSTKTS